MEQLMQGNTLVLNQELTAAAGVPAKADSMALMAGCMEILQKHGVTRDNGQPIQWERTRSKWDHLITNVLVHPDENKRFEDFAKDWIEMLRLGLEMDLRRENYFNLAYKTVIPVDADGNLYRGRAMDVRAYRPDLKGDPGDFMLLVVEDLMRVNRHDPDMQRKIKEAACEMAGHGIFQSQFRRPGIQDRGMNGNTPLPQPA